MGLMVVRERVRWKAGVMGGEGLLWAERERKVVTGEGDALRPLLNCLSLASVGWGGVGWCRTVPCGAPGWLAESVCSRAIQALGLRPGESQALGQPTKAQHCWQGSAGVSVDTLRHF